MQNSPIFRILLLHLSKFNCPRLQSSLNVEENVPQDSSDSFVPFFPSNRRNLISRVSADTNRVCQYESKSTLESRIRWFWRSRVMNVAAEKERGRDRVERGLRPANPCRFAASLFVRPLVCPSSQQHFGPLRTGTSRKRERAEKRGEKERRQGGPGGDAMMRSRHMLRPLGDSPYTRLLINSQAFVLADNTGEITYQNLGF